MKINHSKEILSNYLNNQFLTDLNLLSADQIIQKYGTHVLTDLSLGGSLEANFRSYTDSDMKKGIVEAGIKTMIDNLLLLNLSSEGDHFLHKMNKQYLFHGKTFGGERSNSFEIRIDESGVVPVLKSKYDTWLASLDSSNSVLIGIGNKSLIPIFELVSDASKANLIKEATIRHQQNTHIRQTTGSITCDFDLSSSYDKIIPLDYNGDGIKDLMLYRSGGNKIAVNEGLIDGSFKTVFSSSNGIGTFDFNSHSDRAVALDLDGDGKDDLLCYRPGSKIVYLLRSNGDGSYSKFFSSKNGMAGYDFKSPDDRVVVLDYNADGKDDLIFYRKGSKIVYVLEGNGKGNFTVVDRSVNGIAGFDFNSTNDKMIAFDYDGDSKDDILMYRAGSKIVYIGRSAGNGKFNNVYSSKNGIGGFDFNDRNDLIEALDFNGDGKDDLLCYRPGGGNVHLLESRGNSLFSLKHKGSGIAEFDLKNTKDRVISTDYNNDNLGDLIIYRPSKNVAYSAKATSTQEVFIRDFPN